MPGDADVILIPGSKTTLSDLAALRDAGWDIDIAAHHRRGGLVIGLCGGYQMLGREVADPDGIEGPPGSVAGLGLLDVTTLIGGDKTLVERRGTERLSGAAVHGYEMHMGVTVGADTTRPWLRFDHGGDAGAVSEDGRVMGGYLHGLFAADGFRAAFLGRLRAGRERGTEYEAEIERTLDGLADHLESHLDLDALLAAAS